MTCVHQACEASSRAGQLSNRSTSPPGYQECPQPQLPSLQARASTCSCSLFSPTGRLALVWYSDWKNWPWLRTRGGKGGCATLSRRTNA